LYAPAIYPRPEPVRWDSYGGLARRVLAGVESRIAAFVLIVAVPSEVPLRDRLDWLEKNLKLKAVGPEFSKFLKQ
jgi:hypothetical protein